MKNSGKKIEEAIQKDEWSRARKLIEKELQEEPDNHWLLTRLALTFYEQRKYTEALKISKKAFAIAPDCPLVLWDLAGALEMLGDIEEALKIFEKIESRGIDSLAFEECGEGRAWARGLYADCLYRMSHCYSSRGDKRKAIEMLQKHLECRGPGCRSIYRITNVRRELEALSK
jgi:tetratricopeptide (TPR) repeat protein